LGILDRSRKTSGSRQLESGLTNSGALPKLEESDVDKSTFTGRFAAMWGVTDIALLGDSLIATSPAAPSPVAFPTELAVIDANTLRIEAGSDYGSVGELVRFERDADGEIVSVTYGGMTMYPIETYREMTAGL
jgi:hypothetical protein